VPFAEEWVRCAEPGRCIVTEMRSRTGGASEEERYAEEVDRVDVGEEVEVEDEDAGTGDVVGAHEVDCQTKVGVSAGVL
jgi:hypothetical protein